MGPEILAITRPNCWGGRRIALYSATEPSTHNVAITQKVATTAFFTDLDFAPTRFAIDSPK
jgi:hypothetical protein